MMQSVLVFLMVTLVVASAGDSKNSGGGGGSGSSQSVGIGAYAYQDSSGNRYGGTYDIKPEDIPNFAYAPGFPGADVNSFFPFSGGGDFLQDFLQKLQSSFQDAFHSNGAQQANPTMNFNDIGMQYARAGMSMAQQFMPPAYGGGMNFGPNYANPNWMDGMNFYPPQGGNHAYASGFIGPGGTRQTAYISPENPNQPNIDVSSGGAGGNNDGGFYSVSSSSYSSSSDMGGRRSEHRGAKTVVNDNGKVKEYEVHN